MHSALLRHFKERYPGRHWTGIKQRFKTNSDVERVRWNDIHLPIDVQGTTLSSPRIKSEIQLDKSPALMPCRGYLGKRGALWTSVQWGTSVGYWKRRQRRDASFSVPPASRTSSAHTDAHARSHCTRSRSTIYRQCVKRHVIFTLNDFTGAFNIYGFVISCRCKWRLNTNKQPLTSYRVELKNNKLFFSCLRFSAHRLEKSTLLVESALLPRMRSKVGLRLEVTSLFWIWAASFVQIIRWLFCEITVRFTLSGKTYCTTKL